MKWGVRKSRGSSGSKGSSKAKKKMIDDPDVSTTRAKRKSDLKNRRTLSDATLKKKIARLEDEKKLSSLTKADISPGKSAVLRILGSSAEKTAKTVVSGAMLYGVKAATNQAFDRKDLADYLAPKPKKK